MSGTGIIDQLNRLLADDQNFDTRAGLRFMTELVRDAFKYIEDRKSTDQAAAMTLRLFESQINAVESKLDDFLKMRKAEQDTAADERKFYRRAVIGGIIAIGLSELARWLLT